MRYPLAMLAGASFVSMMSMRLAEPLVPSVAEDLGRSAVETATFITSFALAYGAFQLVHGPLGDRFGRLRVVCIALFAAALACVGSATSASLDALVAWRFAAGMTAGAVVPVSMAFIGDHVPFEGRQQVLGRFMVSTILGGAVGSLVGGSMSEFLSWRASLLVPAVGFVVVGLALLPLALRERGSGSGGSPFAPFRVVRDSRQARVVCGVVAIEGALVFGALGFLGAFLRQRHGIDYTTIGVLLACFAIGGLIYAATVATFVRRLGRPWMVRLGGCLMLVGFVALALLPAWQATVLPIVLLGLGLSLMHNTLQTLATEMAPKARGAALAAFAGSLFMGQAIGVALFGMLAAATQLGHVPLVAGLGLLALSLSFGRWLEAEPHAGGRPARSSASCERRSRCGIDSQAPS